MANEKLDASAEELVEAGLSEAGNVTYRALERGTLQEQIFIQIKERLITGQFAPGQRLTLRGLAAALGTSFMPVRDALQRLESIGALSAQPNRTLIVPILSEAEIDEIREIRVNLEGLAAERATRLMTKPALAQLKARLNRLEEAAQAGDCAAFLQANWHFHLAIAHASGSGVLVSLLEPLWLKMGPQIRLTKPNKASMLLAVPFHRNIVKAISEGEADQARAMVAEDIVGCLVKKDDSQKRRTKNRQVPKSA